jgi:ATP-dependent protease ClpP protease subunit/phage major head subunit gpT-like protein
MITLSFDGIIGDPGNTAADVRTALRKGGPVAVSINSPGGLATEGLAIYNILKAQDARVNVTVDALAASAASLIAMAADKITMRAGALMMVHDPAAITIGTAAAHDKTSAILNKMSEQFAAVYAARTGLTPERVRALMADETWMTGPEAVDLGFASAASDVGATAIAPAFDYHVFKHAPAMLLALAPPNPKRKTPMAKKPAVVIDDEVDDDETIVVDTTGTILASAAAAKLTAVETADIVLKSKGNVDTARNLIITAVAAKAGDQTIQMGDAAGGDEAGHDALIGAAFTAKLNGKTPTGPLHGITNVGIAAEFLRARGIKLESNDAVSTVRQAFGVRRTYMSSGFQTTSDLPGILGDSMHKSLQDLFVAADDGVSKIASVGTMQDFRTKSIGKLSSFPGLELVGESGEITWGVLDEGGEKISVATFARGLSVSLQVWINDNLGAVQRSIRDIAFGAVNLKSRLILTALLNAIMSDGKTLFDAAHGNIVDSTGPSIEGLSAMRTIMRQQKALDGTTVLGLAPKIVLVPSALETAAQLVTAAISPVATEAVNPFSGSIIVAAEPRLDAIDPNAWYGFADPSIMPAVEFDTLIGTPGPRLEIENPASFDRLGTSYRVWWACGAAPVEWRAAVKNSGTNPTA